MILNVVRLDETAKLPEKAHNGDAGFDLFALEAVWLNPNDTKVIPTGIGVEIPYGYFGDLTGKSGLTANTQLRVQRGIIDHGYTGEVGVICTNQQSWKYDDELFDRMVDLRQNENSVSEEILDHLMDVEESQRIRIKKGQKIAQLIISPCMAQANVVERKNFSTDTERGDGGFGSTGTGA